MSIPHDSALQGPPEEAAKQVVLKRYKMRLEGKLLESMQLLSPDFTEHMTPARMPKDGKTAYQRQMEHAQRMANSPPKVDPKVANYPVQARASEDLVTLFHAYGCDIFRVPDGKFSDHWDCTPWETFTNIGERGAVPPHREPAQCGRARLRSTEAHDRFSVLSAGLKLVEALTAARPGIGQPAAANPWIETDVQSGRTYLKLPVPEPQVVQ
jgi:predicted SnoaL-like aldol condensation-catalyzing enzyme